MRLQQFIEERRIKQAAIARVLKVHRSAVHKKLRGERPWLLGEMHTVLSHLRATFPAETFSLDELFAAAPPKKRSRKVAA